MDKPLSEILNAIPPKPPRSKLEPYYDLIRELRRRSKTYREIAQILEEHAGLRVDHSTIYDFVHVRARMVKAPRRLEELPPGSIANGTRAPESDGGSASSSIPLPSDQTAGQTAGAYTRIEALKRRRPTLKQADAGFHYEEGAPLQLIADPIE